MVSLVFTTWEAICRTTSLMRRERNSASVGGLTSSLLPPPVSFFQPPVTEFLIPFKVVFPPLSKVSSYLDVMLSEINVWPPAVLA